MEGCGKPVLGGWVSVEEWEVCVEVRGTDDDDDELMLNVLRCHETY